MSRTPKRDAVAKYCAGTLEEMRRRLKPGARVHCFGSPIDNSAINTLLERERVKVSAMGSYEGVKKIAVCYHDWKPRPAIILGYMHVDAQCTKCKTWWASPSAERQSNE